MDMARRNHSTEGRPYWSATPPPEGMVDLSKVKRRPPPVHGDTWGAWRLDCDTRALHFMENGSWAYELDLERPADAAELLDFILQVSRKVYVSSQAVGDLVDAVDDLLGGRAQGYLCPSGRALPPINIWAKYRALAP